MVSNTSISIIAPVYNAEKYLSTMIESVLMQSYTNWELILINDGSKDASDSIINNYRQKDNRIRCFNQINSGPSIARNKGITEANGSYLTFIDSDDWVSPDYLDKLVQPMLTYDTDLVCAGYYEVNSKFPQGLKLHDFSEDQFNQNIDRKTYQSNLFTGVSGVLWGKLFKKSIFQNNNIELHPKLRLSEDLLAVLEYSRFIDKVFIIPDSIYYYNRLDDGGLSGKLNIEKYANLETLFQEIDKYSEDLNFLDLEAIKSKRKYSFMVQLLKDNSYSKKEFYKIAEFLVEKNSSFDPKFLQQNKVNNLILKNIFNGNYLISFTIVNVYKFLNRIKNG
ncbi:glycosyltransferase family 2 protein [Aequorivita sp. KMM 9714]|uniref:glycosyltransferase family 2 protein n=1 Tax=Aequorivita sp. KMM 9714 TaxID=2707173 RepID=UPI0013E9D29C|nr:glycosyltransferase family 2 protein [Aequorivita sp. KMM 9714]NGX84737.1 glycosyltransferase family 2 protein [Aequorivita sp. KMM 9714]